MASANQWATPRWQYYKKHLPPNPRTKSWKDLVRETGQRGHKGYYHQDFLGQVEELETQALNGGILLSEEGPVRYYWAEFDRVIGASCGEETPFVLVEQHRSGPFHGHPVTWEELKRKGVRDEDRRSR